MSEHRFKVGGRYENEKGPFEVLALKADSMVIEWEGGERRATEIRLQEKILARMEKEAKARIAGKSASSPAWMGRSFTGLLASDFKSDVTGTHWRSREQLGGAVARLLDSREPMNSWAIYHQAAIHWAAMSRYRGEQAWLLAKFFYGMKADAGVFGFYVERSTEAQDSKVDWLNLVNWLGVAEHAAWLHRLLQEREMSIFDPYPEANFAFNRIICPSDHGWVVEHPGQAIEEFKVTELANSLEKVGSDTWVNVVIGRRCPAESLIAGGMGVASTLADCFNALMPVYENRSPER